MPIGGATADSHGLSRSPGQWTRRSVNQQVVAPGLVNAESPGLARPSLPLSELRPGAPESAGTRILFTIEYPGTAVLLAAGMEDDWLRAWHIEAIANCRIRYQREQESTR